MCRCFKSDNSNEKHERELEDKRKDYLSKRDYCKVQIIANEGEIIELKKSSKWKIATKAIYKNSFVYLLA